MKRPFSPVVWLSAVCAAALCALTLFDPSGVYGGYVAALDADTPVLAAVFTAARDGVYPWTAARPDGDDGAPSPAYHPLTETVTDAEMRSSVGNDEPFHESFSETRPAEESGQVTPFVEIVLPASDEPDAADAADGGFVAVDESWFNDALFIGDSHTEGLCDYGAVRGATFYYKRGVDVWSVLKKPIVGDRLTIPQALEKHRFGKIYIMLGINEIGVGTAESFAEQYGCVVSELRELQPDALIYIQAIFHTSQKKSASSAYNNDAINERNRAISALADGEHVFFIDCNEVFDDENGALTPTYTGDGVHVKAPYYTMWRDYLLRFGRAGVDAVEDPAAGTDPVSEPLPQPEARPAPQPAEPEQPQDEPEQGEPAPESPQPQNEPEQAEPASESPQPQGEPEQSEPVSEPAVEEAAQESAPAAEEAAQTESDAAESSAPAAEEGVAEAPAV